MAAHGRGSVTEGVSDLKGGDRSQAVRLLWERYFQRLARLAQARLRGGVGGPVDGGNLALSVLDTFVRGAATGWYPELGNRDDLWRLLVTITSRKAQNRRRDASRQKRGSGRVIRAAALARPETDGEGILANVIGAEPTPKFAAVFADEYRRPFGSLADESLRVVALLKLERYSNEEIARSLDCRLRTVERKLEVIRKRRTAEGTP
jgi:DNA-directed RNA polymerase specialized sigma24 family protein